MWPISERRMIFSCKKEIVTEQWLDNFKALLNEEGGIFSDDVVQEIEAIPNDGNGTIQNLSMSYEDSTKGI